MHHATVLHQVRITARERLLDTDRANRGVLSPNAECPMSPWRANATRQLCCSICACGLVGALFAAAGDRAAPQDGNVPVERPDDAAAKSSPACGTLLVPLYFSASLATSTQDIIAKKSIRLKGIVAIYAANSVGDDIEVYADEVRTLSDLCTLPL